jgi:hypothetical protein
MIYGGQSFRAVLRDLGLTSNQVWGFTKTDEKWSQQLESALTAVEATSSMEPMPHNMRGCVCSECREHQRVRMARRRT